MDLKKLHSEIAHCRKCRLWKNARHAVPGEGNTRAKIMLVGQKPGKNEDETGKPFL